MAWVRGVAQTKIFDSAIDGEFRGRGNAAEYVKDVLDSGVQYSQELAPKRTRRLELSIRTSGVLNAGPYKARGFIYSNLLYAQFVEEGTRGPIVPLTAKAMPVPKVRGGGLAGGLGGTFPVGPNQRKKSVAGQPGQHFMRKGMAMAIRRRSAWRPPR